MAARSQTRDDWLRRQEELRHEGVVTVNAAMSLAPSLFFGTRRCTYSDVVSMVTTVRPLPRFRQEASMAVAAGSSTSPSKRAMRARNGDSEHVHAHHRRPHPHPNAAPTMAWTKQSQDRDVEPPGPLAATESAQYFDAPLEGDTERRRRFLERQMLALHHERRVFMDTLRERRRRRFEAEQHAALVIQRVHRGYVLRRRFMAMKDKLRVRKRIRVNLVKVTKGTAIITGEKERKARKLERQHAAARAIQLCFRRWRARVVLQRERLLRAQEARHASACVIQRQWRKCVARACTRKTRARYREQQMQILARMLKRLFLGYRARQRVRRIRLRRRIIASQRIQWAVQRFLARKALSLQRRRRYDERRHRAAIEIQRYARGMLARARVLRLRIAEDLAIRIACALQIQRVMRGCRGRVRVRFLRFFRVQALAWRCALHVTRLVRGFLARRRVAMLRLEQETDLLAQTARGNTSTVIDLLDGYGIVDAPVDLTAMRLSTRNTMLHLAAKHGHMEILTHVLPKFLDQAPQLIYAANARGETALELAICGAHEKLASFLLTKTADLFEQQAAQLVHRRVPHASTRERSLLLDAARHGMAAIVTKLLVLFPHSFSGKERDAWSKRSLLHEALLLPRDRYVDAKRASLRNELLLSTLQALLTKVPVDVNAQDLVGFTALHLASMQGNLRAVQLLLEHGADVSLADAEGRTAWRVALLNGHEACFREIRRKWLSDVSSSGDVGAMEAGNQGIGDAQSMSKALSDAAKRSHRDGALLQDPHPHLARELLTAARSGHTDRVRFLVLEFGASVNASDPSGDGDSLLMVALDERNAALVRFLLAHAAHADGARRVDVYYVNRAGRSVMDAALQNPNMIKLLLRESHGRVNACLPMDSHKQHRSACHEGVRRGYKLREWLRGYALMPSMLLPLVDDDGRTPLHDAAVFGNMAAAKLLLNTGLRVDQPDALTGRTPLHDACRSGNTELVRRMIAVCPDALWVADAQAQRPVFDAAQSDSVECLTLVVQSMKQSGHTEHKQELQALDDLLRAHVPRSSSEPAVHIDLGTILQNALEQQ